ncbi:acetylglutamate kinase [Pontibacter qinzhouensis]|uniref:Acetylglutamate kinase n=1 Tax=Pontibacter qinzhouensis TaxID=2603253 RepID=A0A5C8JDG5_9BACT|nr:acetylglutamate kinase [Pontibacter qinzhouensis]TXK36435.1 acetylglutamate kinase [Pontibacter qinzhouensis]
MQTLHIIKIGGNILDSPLKLESFLQDFATLPEPKLLIHGGGKIASTIGQKLGIEPNMVEGRRITDAETLKLVTMVYAGLVNKNVVAQLQSMNCNAIGLTGADANIIPATKRPVKQIDYGFVGDVAGPEAVNAPILDTFLKSGITPVCAPLTHDGQGSLLNTNADTIASVLATAMAHLYQVKLIYCFEKKGVLQDAEDDDSVIPAIDSAYYRELKEKGIVTLGMIPKLDNAFAALDLGVQAVVIGDAAEIKAIVAGEDAGTLIKL